VKVRCSSCGLEAEIDREAKRVAIVLPVGETERPFPLHPDCLLAEPLNKILEKVG